jgi:hypothetical protein
LPKVAAIKSIESTVSSGPVEVLVVVAINPLVVGKLPLAKSLRTKVKLEFNVEFAFIDNN